MAINEHWQCPARSVGGTDRLCLLCRDFDQNEENGGRESIPTRQDLLFCISGSMGNGFLMAGRDLSSSWPANDPIQRSRRFSGTHYGRLGFQLVVCMTAFFCGCVCVWGGGESLHMCRCVEAASAKRGLCPGFRRRFYKTGSDMVRSFFPPLLDLPLLVSWSLPVVLCLSSYNRENFNLSLRWGRTSSFFLSCVRSASFPFKSIQISKTTLDTRIIFL